MFFPCRDLPCSSRLVPCRAGYVRRGCCPRRRRASDGRDACAPRELHLALLWDRDDVALSGRPAQSYATARTCCEYLSRVRSPGLFPRMAAALGAAYTLDGRITDAVPLLTR